MILYIKLFRGKFFSYWPDKGCQLQESEGDFRWVSNKAYSEVLSGPAVCGEEELGAAPGGNSNYLDFSTSSSAEDCGCFLFGSLRLLSMFFSHHFCRVNQSESELLSTFEGFADDLLLFLHNPLCKRGIYWEAAQFMCCLRNSKVLRAESHRSLLSLWYLLFALLLHRSQMDHSGRMSQCCCGVL